MGNYLTNQTLGVQPSLVQCKCTKKATYRFSIKVPLDASQKSFIKTYFALKKFSSGVYENREVFVGCDQCVSQEEKQYFTYHPEGWTVGVCPSTEFEDLCSESKNSPRQHEGCLEEERQLEKENSLLQVPD
jgi:hypothetical protein